ncbi:hypothetical protein RND71_017503 [Anisodus tanguticus]|uniref:Uncharacterized protein n=1 Tax=Anisodus tanguticus TaxID=243964 RepID=A0AAE1S2W5_9SOLA|nr:hypothetical protein RND71_017503 [Anisodus tanguticus]
MVGEIRKLRYILMFWGSILMGESQCSMVFGTKVWRVGFLEGVARPTTRK